jgi:Flp pilus assembly protein TadD
MNRKMLARIASTSLLLGVATVGCSSNSQMSHPASLSDQAPKATEVAARSAEKARAALTAHKGDAAVAAAEKAVAVQPENAGYRLLLGQSYLTAGRFASAETSFRDTLTLSPDLAKARFDLALTHIALGRNAEALVALRSLTGSVQVSDLGLAMAMAGDRQDGIKMLIDLIRSGKSDARGRQNLALAFALDGRWGEARAMAMQDTPPDRINTQIGGWAELARPQAGGAQQVAAMLGVKPAVDPGLPTELALAQPKPAAALAAVVAAPAVQPTAPQIAPVALSMSQPAPAAMAVAPVATGVVTVPVYDPIRAVAFADAPAATVVLAAQRSPFASDLALPSLLRQQAAPQLPPPLVARPAQIQQVAAAAPRKGGYVVQLGAYSRAGSIQTAWAKASRLMPRLGGYNPARAQFSFAGGALVRLSVSGFATHADATHLCEQIHARGGHCFVRAAAGDAPIQWVRRAEPVQIATR